MYLRTARLDLDDYNNDTEDGCHTTSMAGTWMAVVKGFGGMRIRSGQLHLDPYLPANWDSYSFKIGFQKAFLQVKVSKEGVSITNDSDHRIELYVKGEKRVIEASMALMEA
jgi:maltose phosphorylase